MNNEEGIIGNRKIAMTAGLWGITAATIFLSVFLIAQTIKTFETSDIFPSNTITVVGEGEVVALPDVASFTYSVTELADDAGTAQNKAAEKSNKIIEILKGIGIEEKDIKTTGYNIYPKYEWKYTTCFPGQVCRGGENVLVGHEVSHTIEVVVREMSKTGEALSLVGAENVSNVSSISFKIDDEDSLKSEAREIAIKSAIEQAEELANQLGVKIVKIVTFNEDQGNFMDYGFRGDMKFDGVMMESSVTPEIPVGENTISTKVYITFEIKG